MENEQMKKPIKLYTLTRLSFLTAEWSQSSEWKSKR